METVLEALEQSKDPKIKEAYRRWKTGKKNLNFDDPIEEPVPEPRQITKEDLIKANIPAMFHDATCQKIKEMGIPKGMEGSYSVVREYIQSLSKNVKDGKGLFLQGTVGTSKTTIAVVIMQEAIKKDISCYFLSMMGVIQKLNPNNHKDKDEYHRLQKKLVSCSLLVIDDLGAEYLNKWDMEKVDFIISDRYNNRKATIFTTNLMTKNKNDVQGLDEKYGARIMDRIEFMCGKPLKFVGESLRRREE